MRSLVITLIVLVAVIAGALATAPYLVDWNDYRGLLTRQAEAITDGAVTIEGPIGFRLLPSPTLTLARTRLTGGSEAVRTQLVVDRLDLRLRPLPLLRGEIRVGDIRLVRPVLEVDRSPGQNGLPPGEDRNPVLSLIGIRPDRLTVIDGRALLRENQTVRWQIDTIDFDVVAQSPDGPFALRGDFAAAGRAFDVDARIGRIGPDRVGTLELSLSMLGGRPASFSYNGAVWWRLDDLRLRGDASFSGQDMVSTATLAADALGRAAPRLPSWLGRPFEIAGKLQLDQSGLQLDELRVLLADTRADGKLSLTFGEYPAIALALRAEQLELSDPSAAGPSDLAPLVALSRQVRGEIDLSLAALRYHDRSAERIRLRLTLSGDGQVAVKQASAMLPGQTDLRFKGHVAPDGAPVSLHGHVDAVTDDLGALLAWLDLEPPGVASDRLRTLTISSALAVEGDAVRLSQTEVRVDASEISGSAALEMGSAAAGGRPRLTADLALDRLNLDAYRADLTPGDVAGVLRRALRDADAMISTTIGRLTWRDVPMRGIALTLHAEQGRLQVSEASLEVAGEANARLDGLVSLESGAFTWSATVHTTRFARLLRRLGLDAPLMLTRAPALTLTASASGKIDQFDLKAEVDDGTGRLTANGTAGWVGGMPRYDLDLELDHPDFNALVRPLGARTAITEDTAPAPLSFAGKLTGNDAQRTVSGSARLGDTSLTGLLSFQQEQPRPRYDLQLSVADPTREMLRALVELTGLGPSLTRLDAPVLGNWPAQPLDLDWLSRFDGSLKLSAKGDLAGDGTELDVRLQDAKVFVDRAEAKLRHGTLSTAFTLDTARPLPFLAGSLDLSAIDAAWLASELDLDAVVEGSMDLHAEATASGSSPYDLVRSLIGRIKLGIASGRLVGNDLAPIAEALRIDRNDHRSGPLAAPSDALPALPFRDLVARFALDRGIASTQAAGLEVDGVKATVSGVVDLLLWAGDLTVALKPPGRPDSPITLKIVGALDRPQTRLKVPPALPAATVNP